MIKLNTMKNFITDYQEERNALDNGNLEQGEYLMQITELTWKYQFILDRMLSDKWNEGWEDCLEHHGIVEDENGRGYSKEQVKEAKELKRR